nr:MAG: hypothetical protein [Microviridae sp.]
MEKTNETKLALVSAIAHKDIKGKELLYVIIDVNGKQVYINIGEKNFKALQELLSKEETVEEGIKNKK